LPAVAINKRLESGQFGSGENNFISHRGSVTATKAGRLFKIGRSRF
jgi:hypothetical protein